MAILCDKCGNVLGPELCTVCNEPSSPWQHHDKPPEDGWYWWRRDADDPPSPVPVDWVGRRMYCASKHIYDGSEDYLYLMSGLWAKAEPPE